MSTRTLTIIVVVLVSAATGGCAAAHNPAKPKPITDQQVRSVLTTMADDLMFSVAAACGQVKQQTRRPDAQLYCASLRLGTALGAMSAATSANARVGFVDLLTLATLQRLALEKPEAVAALGEDDRRMLHDTFARAETALWTRLNEHVTPAQADELRAMIQAWQANNAAQVGMTHVRLADFAADRQTLTSDQIEPPGSILRLLRIDPMQGLDPTTRQIRESRLLAERVAFWAQRMPMILGWQIEVTAERVLGTETVTATTRSATQVARAADDISLSAGRFAQSYERTLDELPKERQAAIEQIDRAASQQLKAAIEQSSAAVARERAAALADAEAVSARVVDRMTWRLIVVVIVGAISIACVALAYGRLRAAQAHTHQEARYAHRLESP